VNEYRQALRTKDNTQRARRSREVHQSEVRKTAQYELVARAERFPPQARAKSPKFSGAQDATARFTRGDKLASLLNN
jgi:hypothetical protein